LKSHGNLRRELPKVKILVVSQNDPACLLPVVVEAGANGCLDRSRLGITDAKLVDQCERYFSQFKKAGDRVRVIATGTTGMINSLASEAVPNFINVAYDDGGSGNHKPAELEKINEQP
jgi:hypothetical protein